MSEQPDEQVVNFQKVVTFSDFFISNICTEKSYNFMHKIILKLQALLVQIFECSGRVRGMFGQNGRTAVVPNELHSKVSMQLHPEGQTEMVDGTRNTDIPVGPVGAAHLYRDEPKMRKRPVWGAEAALLSPSGLSILCGSPRGSLTSAIRGAAAAGESGSTAGGCHSMAQGMLSPRERERYADRLRMAIIEHVLSADCAERSLVLSLPPPLKPPPSLADCNFPPEGETAGAEETLALLAQVQDAAKHPEADDGERQLLEGLGDYLSCICEQLRKCPKTELASELDKSISTSVRQHLLQAIRDFAQHDTLAANAPRLVDLDQHLMAVQEAERECSLMADVRGRKLALNKVWGQLLSTLMFACDAYGALAPSTAAHSNSAPGTVDALHEVLEQLRTDARNARHAITAAQYQCEELASSLQHYAARSAQQVDDLKKQVKNCEDEAISLRNELEAEVDAIVAHIAPRLPALRLLHARAHESGNVASTLRKYLASCEANWTQNRERVQEGERSVILKSQLYSVCYMVKKTRALTSQNFFRAGGCRRRRALR